MSRTFILFSTLLFATVAFASRISLNDNWRFAFGDASDPAKDFAHGTEYFNYHTKAASIHNVGPYALSFNDSAWQQISVPHDWVTSLPFEAPASHSHGYRTVGWRYPSTSVGWYRRHLSIDSTLIGQPVRIVFDGIFRDSRVWVNGFYVGHEESGYTRQDYDITDYLNYGGDNIVCVRVDASLEEGWFYEGAGIYRNVWMETGAPVYLPTSPETARYSWSSEQGFLVDGKKVELKGVNLHQDHAGVGVAVPKGLIEYRLRKLMALGVNAIRCSHNPASEDFLDVCDSLGLYVIEENRLMGSNALQRHVLETMIRRDMHHKCIILWSIGNEEWGLEWNEKGERIARTMQEWAHEIDPSRKVTVATSSGPNILVPVDVPGYNYIVQNDIEGLRQKYPNRIAYGSEETTACGTRGIYYTDAQNGRMAAINRTDTTYENIIERGWKFYDERPWLAGLFYWTGFDYMGEPNPMQWPAVGSEFGILDYCGFPKDEAFYLQSWWTNKPTLHILPHWNLEGHEGEPVNVWVYSNMDEVELRVNGRSLGKKPMPRNGHLSWPTVYQPGRLEAIGYKNGRRALTETVYTATAATQIQAELTTYDDITVIDLTLLDKKNHFAATACNTVNCKISGDARIIGFGNGDPAFYGINPGPSKTCTLPAFNGHAQIIIQGSLDSYECSLVGK